MDQYFRRELTARATAGLTQRGEDRLQYSVLNEMPSSVPSLPGPDIDGEETEWL